MNEASEAEPPRRLSKTTKERKDELKIQKKLTRDFKTLMTLHKHRKGKKEREARKVKECKRRSKKYKEMIIILKEGERKEKRVSSYEPNVEDNTKKS